MARKNYSEEFRQQAVDLYESTPGATLRGIAEDLGIVRGTLRQWLETHGSGKKTAADGTLTDSPLRSAPTPSTADPNERACQMVCVSRTERNGKNHDHDRREDA
ncbi:transposase, partial [Brachybacterium paraconglomeratum]|uniref:transposase n=1 Tax=Brachybacterium paraconglomeratum TaxID=173362 RepID=UPI0022AE7874